MAQAAALDKLQHDAKRTGERKLLELDSDANNRARTFDTVAATDAREAEALRGDLGKSQLEDRRSTSAAEERQSETLGAVGDLVKRAEYLVEDVIEDPAIYPDQATLDNLYTTTPYPPKVQRVVTRLWTKVKSGV